MQKLVTVDSSVIVSALIENEPRHQEALDVWNRLIDNTYLAIIPTTILVEVVSAINRRTGNQRLAQSILSFLLNLESIQFINVDEYRAIESANVSIATKTRGMDSIVIQISKDFNTELITFDDFMNEAHKKFK